MKSQHGPESYNYLYGPEGAKKAICYEWDSDLTWSANLSSIVKYLVVIINYVLRLLIVRPCIYVGMPTKGEESKLVTRSIFICQFLNTAVIMLLLNANLEPQGVPFFDGQLSDFNSYWYNDTGNTIVGTMVFNAYWPFLEWLLLLLVFKVRNRVKDSGWRCRGHTTKKKTLKQYIDLYSGPQYLIHFKYSTIMNIVFVTFLYGAGMPVLFPVAAVSLFVLYVIEKVLIFYWYRQPPMFDEKLNNSVLDILTYAPLLYFSFGYWMLSCPELFSNDVAWRATASENSPTNHIWS